MTLQRRTPLARKPWNPVRKPVNPFSDKRRRDNAERAKVVAQLRAERKGCEGMRLLKEAAHHAETDFDRARYVKALRECDPWQKVLQPHEPLKRSRLGSITDPENIMLLCDSCAEFTEAEVRLATRARMLVPSWSRQRSL